MKSTQPFQAARLVRPWAYFLICLTLVLGGCQAKEPPLSKEAQALRKELLEEVNKLTTLLIEPVAKQDWEAVKPILKKSYEEMEQGGKLALTKIAVMDPNSIVQDMYPPAAGRHWDFSSYKEVKEVFTNQKKLPMKVYVTGNKVYGLVAPIQQRGKVIGVLVMGFPANVLEKKWQISEKEFMSINFN